MILLPGKEPEDMISPATPPTLRSIAEIVGVTPTTVSLALRDNPRISRNMRNLIHQTADELGYRPNAELSRVMVKLKTRQHGEIRPMLGLVVHGNPLSGEVAPLRATFQSLAEQAGYAMDLIGMGEVCVSLQRVADILRARSIRAALLYRVGGTVPAPEGWMRDLVLCCVGPAPDGSNLPSCDWADKPVTPRSDAPLLQAALDILDLNLRRNRFGPPAHTLTCTLSP